MNEIDQFNICKNVTVRFTTSKTPQINDQQEIVILISINRVLNLSAK